MPDNPDTVDLLAPGGPVLPNMNWRHAVITYGEDGHSMTVSMAVGGDPKGRSAAALAVTTVADAYAAAAAAIDAVSGVEVAITVRSDKPIPRDTHTRAE